MDIFIAMKSFRLFFYTTTASVLLACQQPTAKQPQNNTPDSTAAGFIPDTAAVISAFNRFTQSKTFAAQVAEKADGGVIYDEERPILIGDLNNDGRSDAIMPFTMEGMGGGNNYVIYYAVMLNRNGALEPQQVLYRGSKTTPFVITLARMQQGVAEGWERPGAEYGHLDSIPVRYHFKDGALTELKDETQLSFETFMHQFGKDTAFQDAHISFPLREKVWDPTTDSAFVTLTEKDDWNFAKLDDSEPDFTYVQYNLIQGNKATVRLKGNNTGIFVDYKFERINNKWMLVEVEDMST